MKSNPDKANRRSLGPYKLMERIGRGQLTTVYRAVHRLGHVVALQVLPPARARDPALLGRFQFEAELAARLNNLHVVHALDHGEERGVHYLAMEYLEGETLQALIQKRGRLSPEVAAEIVRQALLGLEYLHEQGLVHRNLEPANLMLQRGEDETGPRLTVKILDFSRVRSIAGEVADPTSRKSNEAQALLAPEYGAPEMARAPESADIRADIYALGCVLFHALTGRAPFSDPNPMRLLIRHATEPPPALRQVNPALPQALEPIVATMLAKEPASRFATPAAVVSALEGFLRPVTEGSLGQEAEVPTVTVELVVSGPSIDVNAAPGPPPFVPESATPWEEAGSEVVVTPRETRSPQRPRGGAGPAWSRRDYWLMLVGGIGLLVAEVVGWLIALLFGAAGR